MSRNGAGVYSLPAGNPVTTGTAISSTVQNNTTADIATALTQSIAYDGQTTPIANLPMGGYKHTNVANASNATDYAAFGQVMPLTGGAITGNLSVSGTTTSGTSAITGNETVGGTLGVTGVATFTAAPVGPTQAATDNSTKLATTAHVLARLKSAPAFRAAQSTSQSLTTATITKIDFGTEEFDTNSNFASSRFTPTVAGYYQFNWGVSVTGTNITDGYTMLYQNGSEVERGTEVAANSGSAVSVLVSRGSGLIVCNGSTDYVEVYAKFTGSTLSAGYNRFSGCLLRPL